MDPHQELCRLFDLYRLCELNRRYYGARCERFERRSSWIDRAAGGVSAIALFVILLLESKEARFAAAALSGIAAILTSLSPLTGLSRNASKASNLHTLYSQLFAQVESVIVQIRRDGLTEQLLGSSKQVHEAYRLMHALDEREPDQELITKKEEEVRQAFPAEYLYQHF